MKKNFIKRGLIVVLFIVLITLLFSCVNFRGFGDSSIVTVAEEETGLYMETPSFKYINADSGLKVRGGTSSAAPEWDTLPYGAMVLASSEVVNDYCLIIYTKGTTDYSGYVDVNYLTSEEITAEMIAQKQASLAQSAPAGGNLTYLGNYYITGYDTCSRCCGKSDGITASGRRATVGRTVAMSGLSFGTQIYIEGIGYRVVEDRGVSGGRVDVLCSNHSQCYAITGYYKVYIVN